MADFLRYWKKLSSAFSYLQVFWFFFSCLICCVAISDNRKEFLVWNVSARVIGCGWAFLISCRCCSVLFVSNCSTAVEIVSSQRLWSSCSPQVVRLMLVFFIVCLFEEDMFSGLPPWQIFCTGETWHQTFTRTQSTYRNNIINEITKLLNTKG